MNIILAMVATLDGKITRGEDSNIYEWTSSEDQVYFSKLIEQNNLIVMGRETYEAAMPKPNEGKLRIVLTRNPSRYQSQTIDGQLEFSGESPKNLIARLEKRGFTTMLLAGGGGVNTAFFKDGAVDELWLTLEPVILGRGKMIIEEKDLDIKLQLFESQQLNKQGTILLKYKVVK